MSSIAGFVSLPQQKHGDEPGLCTLVAQGVHQPAKADNHRSHRAAHHAEEPRPEQFAATGSGTSR